MPKTARSEEALTSWIAARLKWMIAVPPELHQVLEDYGRVYADIYGQAEPVADLIPAMLAGFLEGDKAFLRRRRELRRE